MLSLFLSYFINEINFFLICPQNHQNANVKRFYTEAHKMYFCDFQSIKTNEDLEK